MTRWVMEITAEAEVIPGDPDDNYTETEQE